MRWPYDLLRLKLLHIRALYFPRFANRTLEYLFYVKNIFLRFFILSNSRAETQNISLSYSFSAAQKTILQM